MKNINNDFANLEARQILNREINTDKSLKDNKLILGKIEELASEGNTEAIISWYQNKNDNQSNTTIDRITDSYEIESSADILAMAYKEYRTNKEKIDDLKEKAFSHINKENFSLMLSPFSPFSMPNTAKSEFNKTEFAKLYKEAIKFKRIEAKKARKEKNFVPDAELKLLYANEPLIDAESTFGEPNMKKVKRELFKQFENNPDDPKVKLTLAKLFLYFGEKETDEKDYALQLLENLTKSQKGNSKAPVLE